MIKKNNQINDYVFYFWIKEWKIFKTFIEWLKDILRDITLQVCKNTIINGKWFWGLYINEWNKWNSIIIKAQIYSEK